MTYGTKATFEAVREVAFGSIGSSYAALGSALTDHARLVRFVNTSDAEVYISLDGSTNHIRLGMGSFFLIDLTANKVRDDGFFISVGTIFYQKYVSGAPTSGNLWIEVLYAEGGI